jgi:2-amino-4-hydroxy-6-hydroxymethyldihydropteridine diphosphokinase
VTAYVGLGANLGGDTARLRSTLISAWQALTALPRTQVLATSSLWRSAPVDATGPDYLNAVVALETSLAPLSLLHALQAIEAAHGRQRPYRNAPRTLDLDLLMYGDEIWDISELTLPHPRLMTRAFVVKPLLELAPAWPGLAERLPALADQPIDRLAVSPDWPPARVTS